MSSSNAGTDNNVDNGGDRDKNNRHRGGVVVSMSNQLNDAVRHGNLDNTRALLPQKPSHQYRDGQNERFADDYGIDKALFQLVHGGSSEIEPFRLLWAALSPHGKKRYTTWDYQHGGIPLLVDAVFLGRLHVAHLLVQEFHFNVNIENRYGFTALGLAASRTDAEETCRILLDAGANPNPGRCNGPLYSSVIDGTTSLTWLLLQRGADPNHNRSPSSDEKSHGPRRREERNTDHAIGFGYVDILSMLLRSGAFVDEYNYYTPLNDLLSNPVKSRETKLSISRLLVEHARRDPATALFMQSSLEIAIKDLVISHHDGTGDIHYCKMLFEAGMDALAGMYTSIRAGSISLCQWLVREYHIDPFALATTADENAAEQISPFVAAARQLDTTIFEYFLDLWNERISALSIAARGKNSDGNYPVHVICRDAHVSLPAVRVVVNRQGDTVRTIDGEQGLYPLYLAAMHNANLDVIYCLLQQCPDVLYCHSVRNAAVPVESNNDGKDDGDHVQHIVKVLDL